MPGSEQWHRQYELAGGESHLVYYPRDPALTGWEILRIPVQHRDARYAYEVRRNDKPVGKPHYQLRAAKAYVESTLK